jgi:hypothetical protein
MPDLRAAPTATSSLEALAHISESDADAAIALWNRSCAVRFRGLLEAEPRDASERIDRPLTRVRKRA